MRRPTRQLGVALLALSSSAALACSKPSEPATAGTPDSGADSGGKSDGAAGGVSGAGGAGTGGAAGSAGAGGAPAPPPVCAASEPALDATCTPAASPACHAGGYTCGCACSCGSFCINLPPPCTCPQAQTVCNWSCYFQDFAGLVDLHSLSISVGCANPSAPAVTLSLDVTFRAAADGPALTIREIVPQIAGGDGNGPDLFDCNLPMQPTTVGPIAPGTEQRITLAIGPASCTGGNQGTAICNACGNSARVSLLLDIEQTSAGQSLPAQDATSFRFGQSASTPVGTLFPITCTP
jgi:hypothetical protein